MKKISLALLATSILAFGHGSVTPQAVDTKELKQLGDKWLEKNPYEGDAKAIALSKNHWSPSIPSSKALKSGAIPPETPSKP